MTDSLSKLCWLAENFPHSHDVDIDDDAARLRCVTCQARVALDDINDAADETWKLITRMVEEKEK